MGITVLLWTGHLLALWLCWHRRCGVPTNLLIRLEMIHLKHWIFGLIAKSCQWKEWEFEVLFLFFFLSLSLFFLKDPTLFISSMTMSQLDCFNVANHISKDSCWFSEHWQFQNMTDALPFHIHLPLCLWIMEPRSRAAKKNTNHGNEVLPKDTTHLIPRTCYQRESPCQDSAGNWTTRRPPDHGKETQTAVYGHVSRSSGLAKTIL